MSNTETLKKYLLEKDNAYLLDDNNNGKTIMLSGAWGSGKTHFWKEKIEQEQIKIKVHNEEEKQDKYTPEEYNRGLHSLLKNKNKACVYVSLYGKTSIESIELDVYMKAYQNIVGDADAVSKTCSVFTNLGKNLGNIAHKGIGGAFSWLEDLVDKDKFNQAGEYLKDGSVICFDDFERKSKDIDLNDLFGFISQLALEYNSKVIIILNSEVFKDKEAEIFSRVKEKTISKFFYFNPSIEELFESISSDPKYDELNGYKSDILSAIKETKELNARIYTQVLDNCLEWLKEKNSINTKIIRVLVLSTFNFILNHIILLRPEFFPTGYNEDYNIVYTQFKFPDKRLYKVFPSRGKTTFPIIENEILGRKEEAFMRRYPNDSTLSLYDKIKIKLSETKNDSYKFSESQQTYLLNWLNIHSQRLDELWKYGYLLYYLDDIDENTYSEISQFIKTGILLP